LFRVSCFGFRIYIVAPEILPPFRGFLRSAQRVERSLELYFGFLPF